MQHQQLSSWLQQLSSLNQHSVDDSASDMVLIHLVDCNIVCSPIANGGFGVDKEP